MYIELDHALVPRKIEDINDNEDLPGRVQSQDEKNSRMDSYKVKKYDVERGNTQNVFLEFEKQKLDKKAESLQEWKKYGKYASGKTKDKPTEASENSTVDVRTCEPIIGPSEEVFYDEDFGFFSAIIACYNNHWILKTSPDDWWNVIAKTVAQAIDDNGDKEKVREFFIDHDEKKEIEIIVPHLATIDYSWLFDQFSTGIRENIKTPGYVDLMQANFSTTTPNQLISSQVMIMSSMQKYFTFSCGTRCGIPGVEMKGTKKDWEKLVDKTEALEKSLKAVIEDIELGDWFAKTANILKKLLDTYNGNPDKEWWSHILSWNMTYGSGSRNWWSGWMIDFLMAGEAQKIAHFKSGIVSVPLKIFENGGPTDTGLLVAGTVGYDVKEVEGSHAPVVEAKQSWTLLMPKGSPITPYLTSGEGKRVV